MKLQQSMIKQQQQQLQWKLLAAVADAVSAVAEDASSAAAKEAPWASLAEDAYSAGAAEDA